jgi:hypothetical protein
MLKNDGQTTFALKTGNAQAGDLTTQYAGTLPTGGFSGYTPMHQEGGIVLGTGGGQQQLVAGVLLRGGDDGRLPERRDRERRPGQHRRRGLLRGQPGDAGRHHRRAGRECVDVTGDDTGGDGAAVQLWDCNNVGGQVWVQQANGALLNPQSGRCLDAPSGSTANGTRLQIWDCNGSAAQNFHLNRPA